MDESADAARGVLEELMQLEPLFHSAARNAHPDRFEEVVAPEFWEIGASGKRYSREYALEILKSRQQQLPADEEWQASDYEVMKIAAEAWLLSYTLRQPGRITRRCTLWRKSAGRWQAIYHQGTVVI